MAKIVIQNVNKSDQALTYAVASAGGDTFDTFDGVYVHAKNANVGSTRIITIAAVDDPISTPEAGSLAVPDIVITIPTEDDRMFAVPPSHLSVAGLASMTYDDEADITIAILNVKQ